MADDKRIESGDIVNVFFTASDALFAQRVLYVPCATGDSWRLESIDGKEIRYVNMFEQMELVTKNDGVF